MAHPGSSWVAHEQETGQYGSDRLNDTEGLTITQPLTGHGSGGWGAFQVLVETTFTALTDARGSTGLTSQSYPPGNYYWLFQGTITVSAGSDVILYRRPPKA